MSKRILILLLIISFVILTFCTKKSTEPDDNLLPPNNLTISLVENNKIQINWVGNSTNETAYFIDRKMGAYNWLVNFGEVASNITSFTDNIPTNSDTVFSYRIRAFDDENYSAYSDTIAWFSTNSAPSSLQIEQMSQDTLKLTWQDNSIGEEYFRIDRKIDEKGWLMNYAHVPADTTHFLDYTTALYDTCNYKIFAVSGISHSDSTENAFIPFLPAPSNLQLQPLGATEVKLTWQDNCHNEEGYRIFFKRGETALWDSLNLPVNTKEYPDESAIPGIINYYKVCAYYENDTSDFIEDEINTLPAPDNTVANVINYNEIMILWQDNASFEEGFRIERKVNGGHFETIRNVGQNITTYTDDSCANLNTYFYRVCAFFENYLSDYSNEFEIYFPGTIYIPEDYITIQEGINVANEGDIVLVDTGTYYENIILYGKIITVASQFLTTSDTSYISNTIIDGNQNGSVVTFSNEEDTTTIICGFTLINGSSDAGGGIYCGLNSSPRLNNLKIKNNIATGTDNNSGGGGIYCNEYSSPWLQYVIISNNDALYGGGIYCNDDSSPYLDDVVISNNSAGDGGGICCWGSSFPTLNHVIISHNSANYDGGGIYCEHSKPNFKNVIIN